MTPELSAAVVSGIVSTLAISIPLVYRWIRARMARGREDDVALGTVLRELGEVRAVQAACEEGRKNDRRLLRWLAARHAADSDSMPPIVLSAFHALFEDATDSHEVPAE